jgi:hypothetical protein
MTPANRWRSFTFQSICNQIVGITGDHPRLFDDWISSNAFWKTLYPHQPRFANIERVRLLPLRKLTETHLKIDQKACNYPKSASTGNLVSAVEPSEFLSL